jgi:hypothetical protein
VCAAALSGAGRNRIQNSDSSTPASLGLEDDDCIDCMIMQVGGSGSGAQRLR